MLNLDIQRTFDTVSWELLLELLTTRGFGRKFTNCLAALLCTSSTRILVNGELSERIDLMKGLRQGDPLSPLPFVLVMDCLAVLIDKAVSMGILGPIGDQILPFRTSLYTDDAMLFINPCRCEIVAVSQILMLSGDAMGLHTNLAKSSVSPICCAGMDLQELLQDLNCPIKHFPCTYLGMPLAYSKLKKNDLQPICDKLVNRMKGWKMALLTMDGRLDLVKTCSRPCRSSR